MRKFKPPPAEEVWRTKYGATHLPFPKIWSIKCTFGTPRDTQTWLKAMHRTLYVAKHDNSWPDQRCLACWIDLENIKHLADCQTIRGGLWYPIIRLLIKLGMPPPTDISAFIMLGRINNTKVITKTLAGLMFIAWRCLYAAIVSNRFDNSPFQLHSILKRTYQIQYARVVAYGEKWQK